jgi:hypothetical protein
MARPSIERVHAEWLSLVETSGPFLTVPTLKRALPNGLEAAPDALARLRLAHAEWRADPSLRQRFIRWVLDEVLKLDGAVADATDADPSHRVGEQRVTLRPDLVVRDRSSGRPVLLIHIVPANAKLDRPLPGEDWAASPIDRAALLGRASEVPLALVTNGDLWTLVWATGKNATTGTCTWRSELWLEEPVTLRAFATLLGGRRFFNLPAEEGLEALLAESADKQQEVTDRLGTQVRHAVELLVATLDRQDRERHGELLMHLANEEIYKGAVTVMMRLVFLFVAEERRLLPIDDPIYAETLAASTIRGQLQEQADRDTEDRLERSTAAWHRVLALFRAVHGGIEHDALRLPAYGGGLFDPDRYPFLEGRAERTDWHTAAADPLPVDDRTLLHLLDALQTLDQGGRDGARVRLSFRSLDVEQIGHVYEGLLDHTAVRLTETALGLVGKLEPELALADIEGWAVEGADVLDERLARETGRTAKAIRKLLETEPDEETRARLRAVCDNDDSLCDRIAPFHALLRRDLRGDPTVLLGGSLFVTQALDRRSSGTYYTPRSLAEEVVQHALDPVAFSPGPAEERNPDQWRLRPAAELLDLKIADIAMGSGAFLVAACRYLAARLLEAWAKLDDGVEWTVFGQRREDAPHEPALEAEPEARELLAHRLVAERCLYGVDKNPMAVEMAKLSLWLITLAKDRPFSFVDHALRVGDSLVGVTDLRQLRAGHIDPSWPRQSSFDLGIGEIDRAVERATELRRELEAFVVRDVRDAERKSALLAQADAALRDARLFGDLVVGAALSRQPDDDPLSERVAAQLRALLSGGEAAEARRALRSRADEWLASRRSRGDRGSAEFDFAALHPIHWPLEFPEVDRRGGFDAILGNPPFQGGKRITGALGTRYRDFLVEHVAGGVRGSADLVAYFFLRAASLLRPGGGFGLIATNTVAQGDTREVGLDQLTAGQVGLHRAVASEPWPGGANLEMATVWGRHGPWSGERTLDRAATPGITTSLTPRSRVDGSAQRLREAAGQAFQGSVVLGMGFVLDPIEARSMLDDDPRNAQVIKPFLNGENLNSRPDGSPSRLVIDFGDWSLERARTYPEPFERVERLVKPERARSNRALYRNRWWQFGERCPGLYRAIASLDRCIAIAQTSNACQPVPVRTGRVFSQALVVFAYDDNAHFGLLSSGFHWWWAATRASTMRNDLRYTPSDCFETFAQPELTPAIGELGGALHAHRSAVMCDRAEGLTKTYNRAHNRDESSNDIARLRELHIQLDDAVRDAYGWSDLDLGHGFHETRFGVRFTFEPAARQEVLDRLLELNHERYADEVRRGLHAKPKAKRRAAPAGAMTLGFDHV